MKRQNINSLTLFLSTVIFFFGCGSQNALDTSQKEMATVAKPNPTLTAEEIIKSLKAAKLPIEKEIVFTAESDPNKLLGRPNQYIGKASWNDKRYKSLTSDSKDYTVEILILLKVLKIAAST